MKVFGRLPHDPKFLPLHDDDELPPTMVKVQIDGLEVTIWRKNVYPLNPSHDYGKRSEEHGVVDIRIDPINGQAVGIEHEHSRFDRSQVHLQLIADDTGRGIMP